MKKSKFLFISITWLILIFSPFSARAELLTGKIIKIDPDQQQLTLQITGEDLAEERIIEVTMADNFKQQWNNNRSFPGCVRIGRIIRVWGDFSTSNNFLATDLRGPGLFNDPSGVRDRIGRGCRHGSTR